MKSTKTSKNRLFCNELQLKLMIQSVSGIQLKRQMQLNLIWIIVEFEVELDVALELELDYS
jgi:hypothetical protein